MCVLSGEAKHWFDPIGARTNDPIYHPRGEYVNHWFTDADGNYLYISKKGAMLEIILCNIFRAQLFISAGRCTLFGNVNSHYQELFVILSVSTRYDLAKSTTICPTQWRI